MTALGIKTMRWPVLDGDRTLKDLIAEAEPLLWDALVDEDLQPAGKPEWRLIDRPGLHEAFDCSTALLCECPVGYGPIRGSTQQPGPAPSGRAEKRAARLDRVTSLTAAGLSAREIALRVGTSARQVERDRQPRTAS